MTRTSAKPYRYLQHQAARSIPTIEILKPGHRRHFLYGTLAVFAYTKQMQCSFAVMMTRRPQAHGLQRLQPSRCCGSHTPEDAHSVCCLYATPEQRIKPIRFAARDFRHTFRSQRLVSSVSDTQQCMLSAPRTDGVSGTCSPGVMRRQ
jgi:hypothetical protein